jgi:hypothetical protein
MSKLILPRRKLLLGAAAAICAPAIARAGSMSLLGVGKAPGGGGGGSVTLDVSGSLFFNLANSGTPDTSYAGLTGVAGNGLLLIYAMQNNGSTTVSWGAQSCTQVGVDQQIDLLAA